MDIKWIKTFIIAAKHENFRKTSEELFLTQPAVSKHIKRLEERLSVRLFDRIGTAVVLTPAGRRFLPFAENLLQTYEQGLEEFESWKQGYIRKLTVAAAPQIAASILPSILRRFMDHYPDIEVLVNVLSSYKIGEEISSGKADIGLTRIHPVQSMMNCQVAHEERVILAGPAEAKNLNEQTALQSYRLITHNHPDYWDQLLNEIKAQYPLIRTMKVNQVEITKRFIEEGLGVSYLPYTAVREELKNGQLVEILPDRVTAPFSATYIVTKVETAEARAFLDFFKEWIAKQ